MSTAREIEEAIRTSPASERKKLLQHIPALFPELAGDAEWQRIIHDARARPELSKLLDETQEPMRACAAVAARGPSGLRVTTVL